MDNVQQTPIFPAVEGGHSKCIETVSLQCQNLEVFCEVLSASHHEDRQAFFTIRPVDRASSLRIQ